MRFFISALLLLLSACATAPTPRATHYRHHPRTQVPAPLPPVIKFYSRSQAFGEFSNFALFPILLEGRWWPTSEHYYQAMKYQRGDWQEWVRAVADPMEAANRGRDPQKPKRSDWSSYRDEVMRKALRAKFTQHQELRELLLATGEARLVEHTEKDCYWADCGDGRGENKLGLMLEELRQELRP